MKSSLYLWLFNVPGIIVRKYILIFFYLSTQAVVQCIKEKPLYFAERLYLAMKVWQRHLTSTQNCIRLSLLEFYSASIVVEIIYLILMQCREPARMTRLFFASLFLVPKSIWLRSSKRSSTSTANRWPK